jgi:tRNA pseudouridine32 synthase/23S rRNA pseudouridine746 synthase
MEILYQDSVLLVFNKPSGLLAVPGRGPDKQDCLSARVQARWSDALIVHRLDYDTSGIMLLARGAAAQRMLNRAFESRAVHKRYVAVVDGVLEAAPATEDGWGLIDLPLNLDWPNRPLHRVDHEAGKPSLTHWRPHPPGELGGAPATRVDLEPVTGRSHQLRVHLQALGHPILGDTLYASPAAQARAARLLLHACELSLTHPLTGEPLNFRSEPPF